MTVEAWGDCLHIACPDCGAEVDAYCHFSVNGKTFVRHIACCARIKAAEAAA